MRVLILAIPIMVANLAFASTDTQKSKSCNWTIEIFKSQPSEACKKDFLGKVKNDQDKIFVERIFKNWEPLTGYDIVIDNGFIQIWNEKEDDFLQMQWLSFDPAIAYINGVIVTDDLKDPSFYRRMERMFQKAGDTEVVASATKRLSPLEIFLFSDEAYAKAKARAANRSPAEVGAYMFTVEGMDGGGRAAEDAFAGVYGKNWTPNWANNGFLHDGGYVDKGGAWSKPTIQCRDTGQNGRKALQAVEATIFKDNKVTIMPIGNSRTEFYVFGYPGKESVVKVDMSGKKFGTGVTERSGGGKGKGRWRKVNGKTRYQVRRNGRWQNSKYHPPRSVYYPSCDRRFNAETNATCGSVWEQMANLGNETKFTDEDGAAAKGVREQLVGKAVGTYLKELKDQAAKFGREIKFGSDIHCESPKLFSDKETRAELVAVCRDYLERSTKGSRTNFAADGKSNLQHCKIAKGADGQQKVEKCTDKPDDATIATAGSYPEESKVYRTQVDVMKNYVALYKKHGALRDENEICPGLELSNKWQSNAEEKGQLGLGKVADLGTCIAPDANAPKELKDAYAAIGRGAEKNYRDKQGSEFHRQIEKRILGAMMLSECCDNSTCQTNALNSMNLKFEGGKSDAVK